MKYFSLISLAIFFQFPVVHGFDENNVSAQLSNFSLDEPVSSSWFSESAIDNDLSDTLSSESNKLKIRQVSITESVTLSVLSTVDSVSTSDINTMNAIFPRSILPTNTAVSIKLNVHEIILISLLKTKLMMVQINTK